MASAVGRLAKCNLLKTAGTSLCIQKSGISTFKSWSRGKKILFGTLGVLTGSAGGLVFALNQAVKADDLQAHAPSYPWPYLGWFDSYDHASIRRGYEVYKQVCAACHSLQFVAYRHLVNVSHTDEEARAEAEEVQVQDGPDENGNMFLRPGKLFDNFPKPYPNEEAARAANNGAYPPDLTFITSARHGGPDYVFSLLTGYTDPPAGVRLMEGQHFNPYFPGGALSMAKSLFNEAMEYSDGTPATGSQMAKDVVSFLKWTAEQEHDDRKRLALKVFPVVFILGLVALYYKKHVWSTIKTRKIEFRPTDKKWKK